MRSTLTSLSQNLSQMAGPAIGGATIAIWGVGGSFAAQAALLSVGLLALIPLRVPAPAAREERGRPRWQTDIAEGLRFVATSPNIRVLIILLVISALITAGTWSTLLPKLARDELGVGAFGASALFALMGIGTLLSSLVLASMGEIKNGGGWFIVTMMIGSSMMVGLGLSTVYELSLLLMFVSGCNAGFFMNLNPHADPGEHPPAGHGSGNEHCTPSASWAGFRSGPSSRGLAQTSWVRPCISRPAASPTRSSLAERSSPSRRCVA